MALAGDCIGVVNVGGMMANNVSGRGLLLREPEALPQWLKIMKIATPGEQVRPRNDTNPKSGHAAACANDARMRLHCQIFERGRDEFQSFLQVVTGRGSSS